MKNQQAKISEKEPDSWELTNYFAQCQNAAGDKKER